MPALLNTRIADLLAEYPGSAYSEAQQVAAMMASLTPDERSGVLVVVKQVCDLIGAAARKY